VLPENIKLLNYYGGLLYVLVAHFGFRIAGPDIGQYNLAGIPIRLTQPATRNGIGNRLRKSFGFRYIFAEKSLTNFLLTSGRRLWRGSTSIYTNSRLSC
jgi:hypothetical protein